MQGEGAEGKGGKEERYGELRPYPQSGVTETIVRCNRIRRKLYFWGGGFGPGLAGMWSSWKPVGIVPYGWQQNRFPDFLPGRHLR